MLGNDCPVCGQTADTVTISRPTKSLLYQCVDDHLWMGVSVPESPHGVSWER